MSKNRKIFYLKIIIKISEVKHFSNLIYKSNEILLVVASELNTLDNILKTQNF